MIIITRERKKINCHKMVFLFLFSNRFAKEKHYTRITVRVPEETASTEEYFYVSKNNLKYPSVTCLFMKPTVTDKRCQEYA